MRDANLDLSDIYAARRRIGGAVQRTPLVDSALTEISGHSVRLKLETLQSIGAFKLRGAANAINRLSDDERRRGVVCCSTGNHGRAVAHAARAVGVRAVVCLSNLVPEVKVKAIEAIGAEVRRVGNSQDDAELEAARLVGEEGMISIPPFDHPDVNAGQGTIALEILEDAPEIETIMAPVSGGGLIAGIAVAAKTIKPSIRIVGVCMQQGSAMASSFDAGKPIAVEELPSLADSLGGGLGLENRYTFNLCRRLVDELVRIDEPDVYDGMRYLFYRDRLVAEGASAVAFGAILSGRIQITGPTAIVVSGRNVDMDQFAAVVAGEAVQLGSRRIETNRSI